MPVIQIKLWCCEFCRIILTETERVGLFSDPVVQPPIENGVEWDEIGKDDKLACPKCVMANKRIEPDNESLAKSEPERLKADFRR